jgi:c(7)-type cytochrome triheme protein
MIIVIILALAASAAAIQPGKSIEFTKSSMGKVTLDGTLHNKAAGACNKCHNPGMFPEMKKGTVNITMNDLYAGKLCGSCHDGKAAFSAAGNCVRCHKK